MATVGERLRREREARNTTIDEMATATGIGRSYLEALERDEIRELPGKAFGKLYIRAYAEVLEFDPQPWIDDYDRERRFDPAGEAEPSRAEPARPRAVQAAIAQWKEAKIKERGSAGHEDVASEAPPDVPVATPAAEREPAAEHTPAVEPTPAIERTPVRAPRLRRSFFLIGGCVVLAIATVTFVRNFREGTKAPPPLERTAPAQPVAQPAPTPPVVTPREQPPPRGAVPPAKPLAPPAPSGPLTVSASGVGRRVVNSRLEGEGDRFSQGARVCFSTRVLGGRRGDVVRHVWIYEGRTEQTIVLSLGGPNFHTHSNKTLGRTGNWAVEARDAKGAVLARAQFVCGPTTP